MEIITTTIPEVVILKPRVFDDARGYFFESYSRRDFNSLIGRDIEFVQDNQSKSSRGVMRGLHFQRPPFTQAQFLMWRSTYGAAPPLMASTWPLS